jgi:hypothetical protein
MVAIDSRHLMFLVCSHRENIMSIAVKVSPAAQIRRLFETGLDAEDIVKLTGYAPIKVREALEVKRPNKQ